MSKTLVPQLLAGISIFMFLWGCSTRISVEDDGLLNSEEKKSLIDFVKRVQNYYVSRGFDLGFKKISLEIWRSSSFIFHNFTYAKDGKLKIILNKSDIEEPYGKTIIAHEIFHGFQRSYFLLPNTRKYAWITEGTALAMAVEFTEETEVLEKFPLNTKKSILENADSSCWFWIHCLRKKEDFMSTFFQEIKKENLRETKKIYSCLKDFYRKSFSEELDSWIKE